MTAPGLKAGVPIVALLVLASSARAAAPPQPRAVTITASATPWIVLGGRLSVTGGVKPESPGLQVTLQRRQGDGWLPVATASAGATGTFSFSTRPSKLGLATYRVVTPKGAAVVGDSDDVPVRVLHWTYLSDAYIPAGGGDYTTDPMTSKGVTYQHAVSLDAGCYNAWNGTAWLDYPLGRKYEEFTATVGLDAQAPDATTATYDVIGDGKTLASGSLVPNQVVPVMVSLSGIGRLRLEMNVPDPTGTAGCSAYFPHVVFGNAQYLGP